MHINNFVFVFVFVFIKKKLAREAKCTIQPALPSDLSTLPNRQMPSPAYIRCSACKGVFYRPSNLSMFRCPHCHCAHFDRHRQEDNEVLFTFTMLLVFVDLILT
jgi:DNA-directed RNA polymerase subunit RPC12/RpoP